MPGVRNVIESSSFPIVIYEGRENIIKYLSEYQTGLDIHSLADAIARPDVKSLFKENIIPGLYFNHQDTPVSLKQQYDSAVKDGVKNLKDIYKKTFQSENIDALIFPTSPVVAPLANADVNSHDMFLTLIRNTEPGSVAGLPGLSIPAGMGKLTGLPVGLEIDGLPGTDEKILAIGKALEDILQS